MADWNLHCPNCIYYKPLHSCSFTVCKYEPYVTYTTNKTVQIPIKLKEQDESKKLAVRANEKFRNFLGGQNEN